MVNIEDGYCKVGFKDMRELKPIPAVVLGTIAFLLRDPNNKTGEVANKTICDLIGISKHTLLEAVDKLVLAGLITRTQGNGSGNKSIYTIIEKGAKTIPFEAKKGAENAPKRVQNLHEKGAEFAPINKEININKKDGDNTRDAQSPSDHPTLNFEDMENFNLFWELYPGDPDWSYEKENCERAWFGMPSEWRSNLIEQLQNGIRWRVKANDNPVWYLRDYSGKVIKEDLPFVWNGSTQIAKWQAAGKPICVMMYQDGDRHGVIYCLAEHRAKMEAAGAKYLRDF